MKCLCVFRDLSQNEFATELASGLFQSESLHTMYVETWLSFEYEARHTYVQHDG